jgi:3',5'-cyclic AMP phosphodiesterase CpdA
MLIAQISDLHISLPGDNTDRLFRTADHLDRAVAHLNSLARRPDLVLVTGDLVEHGQPQEYLRLRKMLDRLQMPYDVIPGNHDIREHLVDAFRDHQYLRNSGDGDVEYTVEDWPVRLVAVDTTVPGREGGVLSPRRLSWIAERLDEQLERPTILFMHHPPFLTGFPVLDAMGLDGREELASILHRHRQVERVLCGHVHRLMWSRVGGAIATTCPSTAHQVALGLPPARTLSIAMERPACLLHLWSRETGLVTHVSTIDERAPAWTVHDGEHWLHEAEPPVGFHPS